jgi:hypothetical protein
MQERDSSTDEELLFHKLRRGGPFERAPIRAVRISLSRQTAKSFQTSGVRWVGKLGLTWI